MWVDWELEVETDTGMKFYECTTQIDEDALEEFASESQKEMYTKECVQEDFKKRIKWRIK